MSEERRRQVHRLMSAFRYAEARPLIKEMLRDSPDDEDMLLALAVVLEAEGGLALSRPVFDKAKALNPQNVVLLTHLGFALHRDGQYVEAKYCFFDASTIDRDYDTAYTGLAMCQRELGEYEKAEKNLRGAIMAIGRVFARAIRRSNSRTSPIYAQRWLGSACWMQVATFAAMFLAAEDKIPSLGFPTDDSAREELETRRFEGLYYRDHQKPDGAMREFLPNFYDTIRERLVGHPTYVPTCMVFSTVLRALGETEEADDFAIEAEEFRAATRLKPIG